MRETESCNDSECTYIDAETSSAYFVLINPRRRVLLEKLTGPQPVKNFPAFYGTLRITIAFTSARHLSLFWARSIHFMPPSHFFKTHYNIILPSTPRSSTWPLSLGSPHQNPICMFPVSHTCLIPRQFHSSWFDQELVRCTHIIKLLVMYLLHFPINSPLLSPNTFLRAPLFGLTMPSNLTVEYFAHELADLSNKSSPEVPLS